MLLPRKLPTADTEVATSSIDVPAAVRIRPESKFKGSIASSRGSNPERLSLPVDHCLRNPGARHKLLAKIRSSWSPRETIDVKTDYQFLRWLRGFSVVEGCSTLVLFGIAMPMKYLGGIPQAVTVVGTLHGFLFLGLVAMFAVAWKRIPLSKRLVAAGVVGAVVPFGPFVVDRWLRELDEDDA